MNLRPLSLLLLVLLGGVAPGTGWAVPADVPGIRVVLDQSLAQAHTLVEQGRAEEAWNLLIRLLREEPNNTDVNVLLVRAASATGRFNQALAALERLVDMNPGNAALRLELARAYARTGDAASASAEMAIVKQQDPALVDDNTEMSLEKAAKAGRTRYDRFQTAGRLAVGLLWDSNVNGGLDSLGVSVGNMHLTMNPDARKKAAFGEYLNGTLNGGWRMGESSPWWLVGDLSFYGKTYNEDVPSNRHFAWGRTALGLRRVAAKHVFDIRARAEHSSYDPHDHMNAVGMDVSWVYAPATAIQFIAKGGVDSRSFAEADGRNGSYWHGGGYIRLLWGDSGAQSLLTGVRLLGANAKESRYAFDGWEAMLRLNLSPLRRLDISPFLGWREQQYHDAATPLSSLLGEGKREDETFLGGVFFTWHWTESLATEIGWQYTKNHSNSNFYIYDQHQINTGLVYTF